MLNDILSDFPDGPLSKYRKKASFDWRQLKIALYGVENLKFMDHVFVSLSKDPLFQHEHKLLGKVEHRLLNHQRWKRLEEYEFVEWDETDYKKLRIFGYALDLFDQSLFSRHFLTAGLFASAMKGLSLRHDHVVQAAMRNQIVGCFCLTEMAHGSNTGAMGTTATFDGGEFILHTPSVEAVKCWSGNLAQSATHAIVYAQLLIADQAYGPHPFLVQIRDIHNLKPLPGLRIGDMGEKPGVWNGVENGWIRFDRFRIPLDSLLNKGCDVTADGRYLRKTKNRQEQRTTTLGVLSIGRVEIVRKGAIACQLAAVIAIRYSAVRRQFGSDREGLELPIIEYPLQHHRLFPILTKAYALHIFHDAFLDKFEVYLDRVRTEEINDELLSMGREIHGLSCSVKPIATWWGVQALGEARRACGGHGYLKCSRLNDLYNDFDPPQTFEGENNVLLIQTVNFLLAVYREAKSGKKVNSPYGTVDFFNDGLPIPEDVKESRETGTATIENVISAYKWLIFHLVSTGDQKISRLESQGVDLLTAKNHSMVNLLHTAAVAYGEMTILCWFYDYVKSCQSLGFGQVLRKLCTLFAITTIEKYLAVLFMTNYTNSPQFGRHLQDQRVQLQSSIVPEAVSLCDSLAPSDFVLRSALGHSSGNVYENLMGELEAASTYRAPFWADLCQFLDEQKNKGEKSKL